jgi:hypothetical protein
VAAYGLGGARVLGLDEIVYSKLPKAAERLRW